MPRRSRSCAATGSSAARAPTTKVRHLLDDLGLDAAFNYRSGPVVELLREAAPDGIDVYFDSVGGDHLEAALDCLRRRGRVALCGALSEYESDGADCGARATCSRRPPTTSRCGASAAAATCTAWTRSSRELGGWLADGRLHYRQTIVDGLEHAPEALVRMLAGDTIGKTLVRIDFRRRRAVSGPALPARRLAASGRDRLLPVAARLAAGDRHVVHLVGPVGDLQDAGDRVELGQQACPG